MDNMETCVQEIFGEQLTSKAAECTKPALDLLLGFQSDETSMTKEAFAGFKKSHEEACLIATALPKETADKFQISLQIVSDMVQMAFLLHGPEKDAVTSKYAFIKQANSCAEHGEEDIKNALAELARMSNVSEPSKVLDLAPLYGKFLAQKNELFEHLRTSFVEKLNASMVENAEIPPEVESISTLDTITSEFLDSKFNMKTSSSVSDQTIAMSTLLRDVKVACSYMGIQPEDFIDTKQCEINNRHGLTFLRLVQFRTLGLRWGLGPWSECIVYSTVYSVYSVY